MHKNLNHLSDAEIESLVQRYYAGEAVTKLIKEYQLSVRTAELYKLFPPEVSEEYACEYCDEYLVRDRQSKTAIVWGNGKADMYCPICHHRPFAHRCRCDNCINEELAMREFQERQIKNVYSREREPVDFADLSFEQKVYLGALCRALCKENLFEIKPYSGSNKVLAPTNELCSHLYRSLSRDEIIAVSPTSPLEAFVVDDEDFPNRYYTYKVTYYLNLLFPVNKQDLFTEILAPSYYSVECEDEALDLWRKIAVSECIEYLDYQLRKVGFDFAPGDKTYKTFEILLDDFSVSQIYGIIWKAVADASKLYLEKGLSKKHAANSVIGACERYGERAKVNGWQLTEYSRIRDLPQSELSSFFFNRVLGIGDMGFKVPPTIV